MADWAGFSEEELRKVKQGTARKPVTRSEGSKTIFFK